MNKRLSIPGPTETDPQSDDLSHLDADDAPELTPDLLARARPLSEIPELADLAEFVRKGGRPALPPDVRKQRVTILLDPDIVAHFKAGGRGWQTRLNAALRKAAGL